MTTGQLYIAVSDQLLEWAHDEGQLFLFKIGTTSNPLLRLQALNRGWPNEKDSGPCLNCTDWRWAERWHYRARGHANKDEDRLKKYIENRWRVFDRTPYPRFASVKADGATEVYQIRRDELPDLDELVALEESHRNIRFNAFVLEAITRHLRAELETLFPAVPEMDDTEELEDLEEVFEEDDDEPDAELDDQAKEDREKIALEETDDLLSDQDDYEESREGGWLYGRD